MENNENNTLKDFNDYLIMLAEMDKIGIRRKIVLIEGYIHKIKNIPEPETKMVRLANDHTYFEQKIYMDKFTLLKEFDDELYGNYNGGIMFIKK